MLSSRKGFGEGSQATAILCFRGARLGCRPPELSVHAGGWRLRECGGGPGGDIEVLPGWLTAPFPGDEAECHQGKQSRTGDTGTCLVGGPHSVPCAVVGSRPSSEDQPGPDPGPARREGGSPSTPLAHLRTAGAEGGAVDDAALLLGPGLAVRVGGTGVLGGLGVRAGRREFPAVAELQRVAHHGLAPRGEVVEGIVVKVPAQAADPPLRTDRHRDGHRVGLHGVA